MESQALEVIEDSGSYIEKKRPHAKKGQPPTDYQLANLAKGREMRKQNFIAKTEEKAKDVMLKKPELLKQLAQSIAPPSVPPPVRPPKKGKKPTKQIIILQDETSSDDEEAQQIIIKRKKNKTKKPVLIYESESSDDEPPVQPKKDEPMKSKIIFKRY